MSRIVVTIGVCVRNCEDTIRDTIESIIAQTYPHELMEVIFVDDGSRDKTLSLIKEYTNNVDMKVKIFYHNWKGLGPSRNKVIENAEGRYVIWVDGDMKLSKTYVRSQVEFMEDNSRVGIAKGRYGFVSNETIVSMLENIPFFILTYKNAGKRAEKFLGSGGSIYRIKAVKDAGGFDNSIKGAGEDMDLEYRIKKAGWLIYITNAIFHEKRPQTWSSLWTKYFWYGYGLHNVFRKNKEMRKLAYMTIPAAFLSGLLYSFDAYKLTRRKAVFLLPIHFIYKMSAWWLGFIKNLSGF